MKYSYSSSDGSGRKNSSHLNIKINEKQTDKQ